MEQIGIAESDTATESMICTPNHVYVFIFTMYISKSWLREVRWPVQIEQLVSSTIETRSQICLISMYVCVLSVSGLLEK